MISIVTPSFRQVAHLKVCAASVADQRGDFTLEHLIEDGGSGPEFDAWAAEQSFAKCTSQPDKGMYDAINRGFAKAKGDIVAWLNCDEQYLPGALEKVATWFAEHPEMDVLFGDIVLIDPSGQPMAYRQAITPMRGHIRHCFLPTYSAATFVRRKVAEEGHLLDTRFRAIADAVWINELLGAGYRAGVLNEPLAVFTQTGENLGQTPASAKEGALWRRECGIRSKWMGHWWSLVHRARKWLTGAYGAKHVQVSIYLADRDGRVIREADVGGRWRTLDQE